MRFQTANVISIHTDDYKSMKAALGTHEKTLKTWKTSGCVLASI